MAPPAHPARSLYKQQATILADLKAGDARSRLRRVEAIRHTRLDGTVEQEAWPGLQSPERSAEEAAALATLAALRLTSGKDATPARVAPGLYLGGAGAARNLRALRKRGITHVVNAAPCVPCHFRDAPEGFTYLALPLFDDPDADLLPHLAACSAFIEAAHAAGGAVLVHCYAGRSRSAALVMGHLVASRRCGLMEAWAATRRARPCAQPNAGFLRQLAAYARRHAPPPLPSPGTSPDSECELTQ